MHIVSGVDLFTCMCTQPLWCNTWGDPDEGSCLNWVPVFDSMDAVLFTPVLLVEEWL